ncbi:MULTISPECIES: DNA cytosine methyltransferase [unclassified Sulfitobacter]|uniref:DNA cytosine methyltransferase n=2 Tax=Sulfitobacter TaxID=60136 RepID=UPI0009ED4793|nr:MULTISPECIES: DNA cytosine methyltransferase [unclassified Sulfitobacter]
MSGITLHKRRSTLADGPRCVDLFAGAGGLAVGFRQAGWSIACANDMDSAASETFRLNFPETSFIEGAISLVCADDILRASALGRGELDCLIGGPPCQSFSHNNHKRNAIDDRARLFEYYLTLVKRLRPKTLVMENVPGILSIDNGQVVKAILSSLSDQGYSVAYETLSAELYGTPQARRRVFIVASRIGDAAELLPKPTHWSKFLDGLGRRKSERPEGAAKRIVTVGNAIGDLPDLENGGGTQVSGWQGTSATTEYQRFARKGATALYNHVCHGLTKVNLDRIVCVPEGGNWRDIPRELLPAGMQRARLTDHTKRYGRLDRNGMASTLLTKCDPHWGAYVHPEQNRTISVREAARLQGFPDAFQFAGSNLGKMYQQVGNAVPVPLARAFGTAISDHLAKWTTESLKLQKDAA